MSSNNYGDDQQRVQGLPVSFRQEECETEVQQSGCITIFALNGKLFFQSRNLDKSEVVKLLTEVIGKIV